MEQFTIQYRVSRNVYQKISITFGGRDGRCVHNVDVSNVPPAFDILFGRRGGVQWRSMRDGVELSHCTCRLDVLLVTDPLIRHCIWKAGGV